MSAQEVHGSSSTDTLSGIGPPRVVAGAVLAVGVERGHGADSDVPALLPYGELTLRVMLGPRDDWFGHDAVGKFLETPRTVNAAANRVGVRLNGPAIGRIRPEELPSEPCVRGSIQIAADGQPIVLGPDHPVTGGYPVLAVVHDADTDALGQARPGQSIRFRRMSLPSGSVSDTISR